MHMHCMVILVIAFQVVFSETFPTPPILKDNVAFWKKIYTEVSLKEGFLHDRDYPLIIYKKIRVGDAGTRQRSRIIKKEREEIKGLLYTLLQNPSSSWTAEQKRIAALFDKYASESALKSAATRIRFQQGQKERFRKGLYRSGAYLDSIRTIFDHYGIPRRLIYLPHVESSFNPEAYSKVGAAGLWQFMRSTGKQYLKIDYIVDQRRDPIASTYAAAKLLSSNYRQLQSWPLAITAYNHGLYGIKRAVAKTGTRDIGAIIERHESRTFKFASKNFYSCFLAASEIAENPHHYFSDITFAQPLAYHSVTLDYHIKFDVLAHYFQFSSSQLQQLNPAIRSVALRHNRLIPKGTVVHLPIESSLQSIKNTLASIPDSLKHFSLPRPEYYRVVRGDNLYGIARKFQISPLELAQVNNITRLNKIYAGQILQIPGSVTQKKKEKIATADNTQNSVDNQLATVIPKPAQSLIPDTDKKERSEPKTKALPDTVEEVLRIKAEPIAQTTSLTGVSRSSRFNADMYHLDFTLGTQGNGARVRVSVDETIGHYADWLGIATQKIRRVNRMGRRSSIRFNQELFIPGNREMIDRFMTRRLEYHLALEEDFYNQYKVVELKPRVIQKGETLWDICNENQVPLWLLLKHNKHKDLENLFPQMQIWIPVVEEKTEDDFQQEASGQWHSLYPHYQESVFPSKPFQILP